MRIRFLLGIPAVVLGFSIWIGCAPTPEEEEAQAVQALDQMHITATLTDGKLYRIEGTMDDALFKTALPHITTLQARHQLSIDFDGAEFTDLAALAALSNLQSLDLSSNSALTHLDSLPLMPSLHTLNLSANDRLTDLTGLSNVPGLTALNIYKTPITDFNALSNLTSLQTLNLSYNPSLVSLAGFPALLDLKTLNLSYNDHLTDLTGISNLTSLQTLDLSYTSAVADLMPLSSLPRLQRVNLYNSSLSPVQIAALQQARPGLTIEK